MPLVISRRSLLTGFAALAGTPAAFAQEGELFPVSEKEAKKVEYKYRRREDKFETAEPAGTVVVIPKKRFLYLVHGNGTATRYGIAVGHDSKTWKGETEIGKMVKWPVWTPTPEHIAARPDMVQYKNGMPGGPKNPMGARALYLYQNGADTIFRIHGTHDPEARRQEGHQWLLRHAELRYRAPLRSGAAWHPRGGDLSHPEQDIAHDTSLGQGRTARP